MFFLSCETKRIIIIFSVTFSVHVCSYPHCYSYRSSVISLQASRRKQSIIFHTLTESQPFNSAPLRLPPSSLTVLDSIVVAIRLPAGLLRRVFFVCARYYSTQCVGKTLLQCLLGNSSRQISHIDQTSNQRS